MTYGRDASGSGGVGGGRGDLWAGGEWQCRGDVRAAVKATKASGRRGRAACGRRDGNRVTRLGASALRILRFGKRVRQERVGRAA
eukprot:scaffold11542_cov199-Isochrysis_galbana.AAC.3